MRYASTTMPRFAFGLIASLCIGCGDAMAQGSDGASATPPSPETPAPQSAPNQAAQRFNIFEFVVDGNTVLSVDEVEEAVYPFLGEDKIATDVDGARAALERIYQAKGYPTVQVGIPEQGIESGIIHLQVVENPVGRLRVVNSDYYSLDRIKENAPSLAEGTVPNMNKVQEDITALNQTADLKVTPRLKAGAAPGTVDVDLEVEDTLPLHASAEINNQFTQKTKPLRAVASISYDNLWQLNHSANFAYQVAPQRTSDAQVFSGTYLARFPRSSLNLLAYGVKSDSNVAAIAGTNVIGRGNILGLRAIVNLPGDETFSHFVSAGIDRKALTQNVVTSGIPSEAPVVYYPISLAYAATWTSGGEITRAGVSFNVALPGMGSESTDFDRQRFDALRQYFYFKADLSRTQPLPAGLSAFFKAQGQITADALLSSEQLSAGGANTVRGYYEAEALGDYGALGTLELHSPSFGPDIDAAIKEWYFMGFADAAALYLRHPLPGEDRSAYLVGAGIGTRFNILDRLNGSVDLAFPLVNGSGSRRGDPRLHFRVWAGF